MNIRSTHVVNLAADTAAETASRALPGSLGDWRLRQPRGAAPARCTLRTLDGVPVAEVHVGPCAARRSADRGDQVLVSYVLGGEAIASLGGSRRPLRAGDLSLWPVRQPLGLHVPRSLHMLALALPARCGLERLVGGPGGLRIGRDEPVGQMLGGFFDALGRSFGQLDDRQGGLAIGLVEALLDRCVQAHDANDGKAPPSPTLARVLAYCEAHLGDPALTPQRIADAQGMSLRSLQLLFGREGLRVAEWIRDQRLERCRQTISSPGWDGRIIDAALQWGFNSPSHFSRLFRMRFGRAPRQARAQSLRAGSRP